MKSKRRVWDQPFCPSMLSEDAAEIIEGYDSVPNRFMTCAYWVKTEKVRLVQGVISSDRSCRPQILAPDAKGRYADLLRAMKARRGLGVVLNTSFSLHGEPIVCTPLNALRTFSETDVQYFFLENFLVRKI